MRAARLMLIGLLLGGCASVTPASTPIIIYVTPPPATTPPSTPEPSPSPTPVATETTHDLKVTFTLYASDPDQLKRNSDGSCAGDGGFSDISAGMQADVSDAKGELLGFATFGSGTNSGIGQCVFTVSVHDVPDVPVYVVEVAGRGTVNFLRSDLEANGWNAELSLGN